MLYKDPKENGEGEESGEDKDSEEQVSGGE